MPRASSYRRAALVLVLASACSKAPEPASSPGAATTSTAASASNAAPASATNSATPATTPTPAAAPASPAAPARTDDSPAPAPAPSAPVASSAGVADATTVGGAVVQPVSYVAPAPAPAAAPDPQKPAAPQPPKRSPEDTLRVEVGSWKKTPYREDGTTRKGIGNPGFVRAVFKNAFDVDIPSTVDKQINTGKLIEQKALAAGDLVFFDGKGFGPFRPKIVGIYMGRDQFALAEKDLGVSVQKMSDERWKSSYKTARRMPTDPNAAAPTFDAASYGENRAALMRDIAKAWVGTLYKQNGKSFDGIDNDDFVRSIYEAIYDTELTGTPKTWETMGVAVKRTALQPGDIIIYQAGGLGKIVNLQQAGLYIGDGEFVHALRGSAVTISKLKDKRWSDAYVMARRIDPDALEKQEEKAAAANGSYAVAPTSAAINKTMAARVPSEDEARLRDAVEPWRGTPYKLGGTSKAGIDCSALVRELYEDVYGVKLPRTAEEQESLGSKVDRKSLQTGDLVFFRTQGMGPLFKSRHVGLYLGGGEFAQASGSKGVNIARLDNYYWNKKYEGARRLPKS